MLSTVARDTSISKPHPASVAGPAGHRGTEGMKESHRDSTLRAASDYQRLPQDGRAMIDLSGTWDQEFWIEPSQRWCERRLFKGTPFGDCEPGKERRRDIRPNGNVPPPTSSCSTVPMRELRTSPFHQADEGSHMAGAVTQSLGTQCLSALV